MENSVWTLVGGAVLTISVIYIVSKLFTNNNNEEEKQQNERPAPPKLQRLPVGRLTLDQISQNTGANDGRILLSICGRIFDMSAGRDFYGINGPYSCFAGGDASYMLGAMSLEQQSRNKTDYTPDGDHQMTLGDWIARFRAKYPIIGRLDGFEHLSPESWEEAGTNDSKVNENESIVNGTNTKELETITLEELLGSGDDRVSVAGYVFDVTGAEFVYADVYGDFPGAIRHDISVSIAKNDFSKENFNKPLSEVAKDMNAKKRLKQMFHAFRDSYEIKAKISDEGFNLDSLEWDIVEQNEAQSGLDDEKEDKPKL